MLGALKKWLFQKAITEVKRSKKPLAPLHNNPMTNVSILIEHASDTDNEVIEKWIRYLKKNGKRVNTLTFYPDKKSVMDGMEGAYSPGQMGFDDVPKGPAIDSFIRANSDILLVFCHHFYPHLQYIACAHDSFMKVGLHFPESESYFHLLVDIDSSSSYQNMIDSITKTISIVSQNTKP